jgi:hypothetical protein
LNFESEPRKAIEDLERAACLMEVSVSKARIQKKRRFF